MKLQKLESLVSIGVQIPAVAESETAAESAKSGSEPKAEDNEESTVIGPPEEQDQPRPHQDQGKPKSQVQGQTRICQMPKPETMIFYGYSTERDKSLRDFCDSLKSLYGSTTGPRDDEEMSDIELVNTPPSESLRCGRAGCEIPLRDHETWWYHSGRKITMRMASLSTDDERVSHQDDGIEVWVVCRECGKQSQSRVISQVAE